MPIDVILPKVDMDMATGKITKWFVRDGDSITEGETIFEIETDKATMEIEAYRTGIIANLVPAGIHIPIGRSIAQIFLEGEPITYLARSVHDYPALKTPVASTVMDDHGSPYPIVSDGSRATPAARRLAREAGIALSTFNGTGPQGRIQAADITVTSTKTLANATRLPLDPMRRSIAERLSLSKQTIPHFYVSVSCDMEALLKLRQELNLSNTETKLSLNDFLIKALGLSLTHVPEANVSWQGTHILKYHNADVAVAVAVAGGVFTPVIQAVESLTLPQIAATMQDLTSRARQRKLAPAEYQGGSTSISNLGMYGIEEFTAIINPPHASILAIGAVQEQFIPRNGQPVLRPVMKCTLSCDHRVIDGAIGAKLLSTFKTLVETPQTLL